MVLCIPYTLVGTVFYGIIFHYPHQCRHFNSILRFYRKFWSVALIYHMVLLNVQKFFDINYILLPYITIKKIKLNKIL
jgi:hypothetical protein